MKTQRGFTLIEAIVVIVITGILVGIVSIFIRGPVQNYVETAARAELADAADTALRRITREVHRALPNSVRVGAGGTAVEFFPTSSGGRYLAADDVVTTTEPVLDFNNTANTQFAVVGQMPTPAIVAGTDSIVIFNLGGGMERADAYAGRNIAAVASVSGNRITMASNPFAVQDSGALAETPLLQSPGHRFHVVSTPVMYICDTTAGTLTRYWGYSASAAMTVPPVGASVKSARLASNLTACTFSYDASSTNTRTALLSVSISLQRADKADPPMRLLHQVHVDNSI
jgi:MSHA biogenesis protein MshO